ncbi:DUF3667 domain-containing protein [Segetibacter sp. 3557_3]|uniref:DUF3667 domain-containing protein n=1 Tax=Segetibacter sp. 3557_3 TaxID=2547429 RepID=UPI001058DD20|nr:DUF3667 domain-containing protein [Segetibacter sp. 3557_3]TDH27794.1 DUF3667 domain-containing protein [Segetibacter sp. 3557_3]
MSHFKERKEKNCLNCSAEVQGRYCHVCGQENIEPRETFWHLITHFVYDITHFDGKFFSTSRLLLFKPGLLSLEYMKGRRVSYLNPIKMYVFTSALFFLFFFAVIKAKDSIKINKPKARTVATTLKKIEQTNATLKEALADSGLPDFSRTIIRNRLTDLEKDIERLKADTTDLEDLNYYKGVNVGLDDVYTTAAQYDSVQRNLPSSKRDNWVKKQMRRQSIVIKEKYGNDKQSLANAYLDRFIHFFPQMMFLSLPLFALILYLLYARRRNNYLYVDHVIYSIHVYCAAFIFFFVMISLTKLSNFSWLGWLQVVNWIVGLYAFYYGYKALRNFYQQGRGKTIVKYILLTMLTMFLMSMIFFVFLIFSVFVI